MGQQWEYAGLAAVLPWGGVLGYAGPGVILESSSEITASPESAPVGGTPTAFILEFGEDGEWHAWEHMLTAADMAAAEGLSTDYAAQHSITETPIPEPVNHLRSIKGPDDRVVITKSRLLAGGGDDDAFTSIRTIRTPVSVGDAQGTGLMLEARIGITAAHNFYDGNQFIATGRPTTTNASRSNVVRIQRVYIHADWFSSEVFAHDWALFQTSSDVWLGGGTYFTLDSSSGESSGDLINQIGIVDAGTTIDGWLHSGCEIKDVLQERLAYSCDTINGHSGGPVYKLFSTGERQIVASHAGAGAFWNSGPRISTWRGDILTGMAALPNGSSTYDPYDP